MTASRAVGAGANAADVLSWHNDQSGTGSVATETTLSPATVSGSSFGKVGSISVDGQVYAQPLYVESLRMNDGRIHSVLFVATENDSIYALDANNPTAGPQHNGVLWHDRLVNAKRGITPVTSDDVGVDDITPNIGITGTPVIDPATDALYLVAKTKQTTRQGPAYFQKLYALNLSNGRAMFGGPTTLGTTTIDRDGNYNNQTNIQVAGTGAGSTNGVVSFNALRENQRSGLALDTNVPGRPRGMIVVAYSSHGDINPYHGWVLGFDPRTLKLVSTYNTTSNGDYGAIWQGGGAPTILPNGDILAGVGNGSFDAFTTTATPGPTAIGTSGPGLGFEGLNNSVAISFNAVAPSPGTSGTGLFFNGIDPIPGQVAPNQPVPLVGTGIDFTSAANAATPHTFEATLAYDGSTLNEAIRDLATGATFTHSYSNVNIPAAVGGSTAYVGFGGATDGIMATQTIQSWNYGTAANPTSAVNQAGGFASTSGLTANGQTTFTQGATQLTDGGGEEVGTVFSNQPVNVQNFVTTFRFQIAAPPADGSSSGSSSSSTSPIGDGITFILQNANGHPAGSDYGESVVDLRPTGRTMTVVDSFTPSNYQDLIQNDKDLGSTAILALPSFPGTAAPNLAVAAGKAGTIYLLNRDNLGGYTASGSDQVIQEINATGGKGFFASPSYSNGHLYYQANGDVLRSFSLVLNPATNVMQLVPDPVTSTAVAKYPGTSPATSSDGGTGGIVWTVDASGYKNGGPAVLTAYDASNLGNVLFQSSALPANQAGPAVKFVSPTIANGRVYVGLGNEVDIYGLLANRRSGS